jgi:drug/metabolite transporter (DMT)-like permease
VPHFTVPGWLAVIYIGFGSGLGYYLWLWALNHTSPTKVTIFLALNPITAVVFGTLFLGEQLSLSLLLGLVCVIAGLGIAHLNVKMNANIK